MLKQSRKKLCALSQHAKIFATAVIHIDLYLFQYFLHFATNHFSSSPKYTGNSVLLFHWITVLNSLYNTKVTITVYLKRKQPARRNFRTGCSSRVMLLWNYLIMKMYKHEPKLLPLKQYFFQTYLYTLWDWSNFYFVLYDKNFLV